MTVGSTAFVGGLLLFALGFILRVLGDIAEKLDGAVHFEADEDDASHAHAGAAVLTVETGSFASVAPDYPEPSRAAPKAPAAPDFPEMDELPEPTGERGLPSWFRRKRADEAPADEPVFEPEPALAETPDFEPLPPFRSATPVPPRREAPPVEAFEEEPYEPRAPRAPRAREEFTPEPAAPPAFLQDADLLADEPEAPPAAPDVTVLKSGTIGGMAYKLYSDGSIEADLPDGTLRFASLQELRDHVAGGDNRG
ncbi:hypothetical protein [Ancylobacter sp. TS-1]|uniref:hypothetical protein n=1 Tax=Ancylobacter sp. TS-1 TaxID=1850374 RepID=UPI001FEEE233|nr:hypothetical protein [Ancylobacter sp. TS-1]